MRQVEALDQRRSGQTTHRSRSHGRPRSTRLRRDRGRRPRRAVPGARAAPHALDDQRTRATRSSPRTSSRRRSCGSPGSSRRAAGPTTPPPGWRTSPATSPSAGLGAPRPPRRFENRLARPSAPMDPAAAALDAERSRRRPCGPRRPAPGRSHGAADRRRGPSQRGDRRADRAHRARDARAPVPRPAPTSPGAGGGRDSYDPSSGGSASEMCRSSRAGRAGRRLVTCSDAPATGSRPCSSIGGEAGVGRTRLVEAIAERCAPPTASASRTGTCVRMDAGAMPYRGDHRRAARAWSATTTRPRSRRRSGGQRREIARLLPEVARLGRARRIVVAPGVAIERPAAGSPAIADAGPGARPRPPVRTGAARAAPPVRSRRRPGSRALAATRRCCSSSMISSGSIRRRSTSCARCRRHSRPAPPSSSPCGPISHCPATVRATDRRAGRVTARRALELVPFDRADLERLVAAATGTDAGVARPGGARCRSPRAPAATRSSPSR